MIIVFIENKMMQCHNKGYEKKDIIKKKKNLRITKINGYN